MLEYKAQRYLDGNICALCSSKCCISIVVARTCCCTFQYDPEGFGEIPWDDFLEVLNNPEFIAQVDANKRDILLERAQERTTTAITFQDFVNVVSLV